MVEMWNDETKVRAASQRDKVLEALRSAENKGVTNIVLKDIAFRFGQAIHTLYQQGYEILTEDLGDGVCLYTLTKEPMAEKPVPTEKAIDILVAEIKHNHSGQVTAESLKDLMIELGFDVKRKKGYYATNNKIVGDISA